MPTIFDTPPADVQKRLTALRDVLDIRIPAKRIDRNLLIATWNIRAFGGLTRKWGTEKGDSPRRGLDSIRYIAEILSRFDVIAIQEVKGNLRAFRDTLKVLGRSWSFILTDVTEGSAGNGERMAYLFDTRRVQLSGLASEIVIPQEWLEEVGKNALREQFVRTPYAVSFRSERKTFILVTLHILYGKRSADRITELATIARWIKNWATDVNAYDHNLICLGDFNIDERGDLLHETFISEGLFIPPTLQHETVTRSIFDAEKYYDQIAWFVDKRGKQELSMQFTAGGNFDFVPILLDEEDNTKAEFSFMLSDHYPLWGEFDIRDDDLTPLDSAPIPV